MTDLTDPGKRREIVASLGSHLTEYRAWITHPDTVRFITIAADFVQPPPSTDLTRATHAEAVARLVKAETVQEFVAVLFRLESLSGLDDDTGLPPASYGAEAPKPTKSEPKPAKPSQA